MIRRAWRAFTRGIRAETQGWSTAKTIIAGVQAPAPGNTRVPAPAPVPGQQAPPVPAHGRPPRPAPAPAHDCGPVQAGIGFNREGCMYVWEPAWGYWQHKQHRLPFNVTEWEAKLP